MTSFEIMKKALENINTESIENFRENMKKVSEVFDGIKVECSESQLKELQVILDGASKGINGMSEEMDSSGYLGLLDDELFAMLMFQNILEIVT